MGVSPCNVGSMGAGEDEGAALTLAERWWHGDGGGVLAHAGRFAYGLQWLGDYLYRQPKAFGRAYDAFANDAEPTFRRWWSRLYAVERQLLKGCLGGEVKVEGLNGKARRRLRSLAERGFVVEMEGRF